MSEEEDIGLETLQAQVDMSLAFTQNLVSSWLKPTEGKLPSSRARNDEKELEEYMRRPPRLGVGASIPESTSLLSRDSARLKSKLTSAGKKRAREEEDEVQMALLPSDDEEESKANVIKKKTKVDPFAPKEKGKKRVREAPKALNEHPSFQKLGGADGEAPATSAPSEPPAPEREAGVSASPLSAKKKKKKKKNRSSAPQLIIERPRSPHAAQTTPERPTAATSSTSAAAAAESARISTKVEPITETLPPSPAKPLASVSSAQGAPPSPSKAQVTLPPSAPPSAASTSLLARHPNIPLLNLDGPPPAADANSMSPSKKRRRKKKKKKAAAHVEQTHAGDAHDDGDSDGSD